MKDLSKKSLSTKIPLAKALFLIFLSTLLLSGTSWSVFFFIKYFYHSRWENEHYNIVALVQTGPERESLKTSYLAELLGLSSDQPANIYHFDLGEGQKKMLDSPLIKSAVLKRITPGTLYVEYAIRRPVAFLEDYSNTAIDEEGVLIPFKPFFSPKKIPKIYLGLENDYEAMWGAKIRDEKLKTAFGVLNEAVPLAEKNRLAIESVDMSQWLAKSYGQRQIVLKLVSEDGVKFFLRLNHRDFIKNLRQFSRLDKVPIGQSKLLIFDLRIPHLAFMMSSS